MLAKLQQDMKISYICKVILLAGLYAAPAFAEDCKNIVSSSPRGTKLVERSDVEANISKLLERRNTKTTHGGFFGPSSMMWEINRVPFLMLFAETELYLQLAHPPSAQGVYDHSKRLKEEPLQRFQSTFFYIWGMIYGDVGQATKLALTLQGIHARIKGTLPVDAGPYKAGYEYSANDPFALLWIHATHWYAVMRTYEVFVRKLSPQEKNAYIADTKTYAMLLGIPEEMIPSTWSEFKDYFDSMIQSNELTYSRDALKLERHFRQLSRKHEKFNPFFWAARKYSDAITASTLPEKLADQVGLNRSASKMGTYVTALKALRVFYQLLPSAVRDLPLYRIAMARAAGEQPSRRDELLYRVFTNKITPRELLREIEDLIVIPSGARDRTAPTK